MDSQLLQGKKIIIVEDNSFLSSVISQKLSMQGAKVLSYQNGLEGLAAIRAEKPDVILMDIQMPVMNGYEVLQVMQSENLTETMPVIVISNSGETVEIDRIKQLGVSDYLVKADFEPQEVIDKVYRVLSIDSTVTTTAETAPESAPATPEPAQAVAPEAQQKPKPTGMPKVLIVEDDPLLRNLLSMKLNTVKCPMMFSNDGLQALTIAETFLPEIIVLDLRLPGKDGFEVLQELKAHPTLASIPVVVFSNNSAPEDQQRATQLGASGFHVKAVTDLDEFIKELLSLTGRS